MEKTINGQIKIAVLGPESAGKTTLCKELSETLNCEWVPEFARTHLSAKPLYTQPDLDFMLEQQLNSESKHINPILICDGDPISFKVWSQYKFGSTSEYIEQKTLDSDYNHYLLLRPDLPYEKDPLRENSSLKNRQELFILFLMELNKLDLSYSIVEGLNENRLNMALNSLRKQKII